MSGNALLLLLTGLRGEVLPDFAISVNAPIDLAASALALEQGLNRLYDFRFVSRCREEVKARAGGTHYSIPWNATLRDFDQLYTAPASGFSDREAYYRSCSTRNLLTKIQTPTLILTAEDDPFVGFSAYQGVKLSPTVRLHAERTGGHMGYVTRDKTPLGTYNWLDYALRESISAGLA